MLENNNSCPSLQELADTLKCGNGKLTVSDVGNWWSAFVNITDKTMHNFVVTDTISWRDYGTGVACDNKDSMLQPPSNILV